MRNVSPQVFLGGTVGANRWRETIVIPGLVARGVAANVLFNPVVTHWSQQAQQHEDAIKRAVRYLLYVIASPDPVGSTANVSAYSLVELTMSLYDSPDRAIGLFDTAGMPRHTAKAIRKSAQDLRERFPKAPIFTDYEAMMDWLAERLRENT